MTRDDTPAAEGPEIDTMNRFVVAVGHGGIIVMAPPRGPISDEDARILAAYLVALSGGRDKFLRVLDAVEST